MQGHTDSELEVSGERGVANTKGKGPNGEVGLVEESIHILRG